MKVDVLVSKYKALNTDEEKEAFIKRCIKTTYVNYEQKYADVTNIVNPGNHTVMTDPTDETKMIKVFRRDTPMMYYQLKLTFLRNYSDIEFESKTDDRMALRSYNLLESIGFIDSFIASLPENEVAKYHSMLDMMNDDMYLNERDVASFFDTKIDALSMVLNTTLGSLGEVINSIEQNNNEN